MKHLLQKSLFFTDSWKWASITIDEGHRIKNEKCRVRECLNRIRCPFRLLLTGTPLQNNLHELWALLNYILPEVFKDSKIFDNGASVTEDMLNLDTCAAARSLLENHMMIRRIKADVEHSLLPKIYCTITVPLTDLQICWYKSLLRRHDDAYLALLSNFQILSILSQLRKVVNHPKQILLKRERERAKEANKVLKAEYACSEFCKPDLTLLPPPIGSDARRAEDELRSLVGETLITSCGKLRMLDRLLLRLKSQGSRCLVFSQFTETLDILEEYTNFRFGPDSYFRLDGDTHRVMREINTRTFNDPLTKSFLYLISTRAGGVGINLATADSVILYDSCWNPQVDLQAQDRAHRIGQKKQVTIFRLVSENTFEERVLAMAYRKLLLDKCVIAQQTGEEFGSAGDLTMSELINVLKCGTENIFSSAAGRGSSKTDAELDADLDAFIKSSFNSGDSAAGLVSYDIKSEDNMKTSLEEECESSETLFKKGPTVDFEAQIENASKKSVLPVEDLGIAMDLPCLVPLCQPPKIKKSGLFDPPEPGSKRPHKAPKRFTHPSRPPKAQKKARKSEDQCFECHDGGEVMECNQCPKVYHIECVGLRRVPTGVWLCPWHKCSVCSRNSSNSGGMQFRCLQCPQAYCFDCWPPHMDMVKRNPPDDFVKDYVKRGYTFPKNVLFFTCTGCDPVNFKAENKENHQFFKENAESNEKKPPNCAPTPSLAIELVPFKQTKIRENDGKTVLSPDQKVEKAICW